MKTTAAVFTAEILTGSNLYFDSLSSLTSQSFPTAYNACTTFHSLRKKFKLTNRPSAERNNNFKNVVPKKYMMPVGSPGSMAFISGTGDTAACISRSQFDNCGALQRAMRIMRFSGQPHIKGKDLVGIKMDCEGSKRTCER